MFNASYNNNQAVEIHYSVGQKTLRYTLILKTGKVISYTSTLNISETARVVAPCYKDAALTPSLGRANLQANIPFTSYNNDKPLDSPFGRGEVEYFLRSKNTDGSISNLCPATNLNGLRKPIIMLDGFDPQDARLIGEIYDKNLVYDSLSTPRKNLAEDLRNQGYDVVILNFPKHELIRFVIPRINPRFSDTLIVYQDHGTDYVERNAMVLVKLIQQINAKLATNGSTEQLTIVGPSMGGLISQYALAYMEKNGMNHNTKLWISHDSPHNGANIPIGAQEFLRWSGEDQNTRAALFNFNFKIKSIAAKQILLHHITTNIANPNVQLASSDPFRAIFLANVASNGLAGSGGFPQNLRRVAISNGSNSGQLYGLAGDEAVRLEYVKLGQVRARAMAYFAGGYGVLKRSMYYKLPRSQF